MLSLKVERSNELLVDDLLLLEHGVNEAMSVEAKDETSVETSDEAKPKVLNELQLLERKLLVLLLLGLLEDPPQEKMRSKKNKNIFYKFFLSIIKN
jgi:hypothetical protein